MLLLVMFNIPRKDNTERDPSDNTLKVKKVFNVEVEVASEVVAVAEVATEVVITITQKVNK